MKHSIFWSQRETCLGSPGQALLLYRGAAQPGNVRQIIRHVINYMASGSPNQVLTHAARAAARRARRALVRLTGDARLEFLRNSGPAPEMKMERAGQ